MPYSECFVNRCQFIKKLFYLLLLGAIVFSCKPDKKEVQKRSKPKRSYFGYWYETSWEILFGETDSLILIPNGHFSTDTIWGTYKRMADTVFVKSKIIEKEVDAMSTFIFIDGDSCFYDLMENVYCLTSSEAQERQLVIFEKHEKIVEHITSIAQVREVVEGITQHGNKVLYSSMHLIYENDIQLYQMKVLEVNNFSFVNHLFIRFDPVGEKVFIYDSIEDKWEETGE